MQSYKLWVRNNASAISYVESGLSSLTYLLPDRFASSELLCEGLNALVGLLSVWHDSILYEPVNGDPKGRQYQLWLAALQQIETLIELRALHLERQGKLSSYGPLAVLEFCKATLRLLLLLPQEPGQLLVSESVALTPAAHTEAQQSAVEQRFRQVQEALRWFKVRHKCVEPGQLAAFPPAPRTPPPPSKKSKPHNPTGSSLSQATDSEIQPYGGSDDAPEPSAPSCAAGNPPKLWWMDDLPQLSPPHTSGKVCEQPAETEHQENMVEWEIQFGHSLLLFGEVLYLYRPVLYVLLLKRYGRKSWSPWLASLAVEVLSGVLLKKAAAMLSDATGRKFPQQTSLCSMALLKRFSTFHWTAGEEREMARRRIMLLYYLLRSPFFDSVTKPFIKRAQRPLQHIPLVGSLADKMMEILEGIQQYYTYTSAS